MHCNLDFECYFKQAHKLDSFGPLIATDLFLSYFKKHFTLAQYL